ncbi:serine/threonine-protein phosphatase 1 regulatory subunit 10-like isoform X1 [Syngnathus scovelli]|uniref:serine/threonine-protein phosphatase 1 regulatory subunit 10-like isoform X1 n=1 Tax=Syngnathus scovelli TaxID=161590 RepID=UPI0021103D82|nr:serine/threonine-protein phosphatase 1 regulatory subunit 10-like isoform X1 [Syngnathus scovelli]XP_049607271.1 serine/threonine-protein phosphatase 1 regulatory subunit 10-like isoform X1 [Syngnathus scovelli]XP_049607272.1 serine/threonine-protein phosphatase 1 regulatory subunit 10-like isoform X1 [Syngnathus scovelli]
MEGIQSDPKGILAGGGFQLGKDGGLCSLDGVPEMISLMQASTEMVNRCMYLEILLHTKCQHIFSRFIRAGGYTLLNSWLTYSKSTNNTCLLQLLLLTLQKLPLKVVHLKQNNTAKLVKQLSKRAATEELRKLASALVDGWMETIRSQSLSSASDNPADKKKQGEKLHSQGVKDKNGQDENKKQKAKAHLSRHAMLRSFALDPPVSTSQKTKPPVHKRSSSGPCGAAPPQKKRRPRKTSSSDSSTEIIAADECQHSIWKSKKKSVHWAQEDDLKQYFYFDQDETERANVYKIKEFFKSSKHEMTLRPRWLPRHEERVHWTCPSSLTLAGSQVTEMDTLLERSLTRQSPDSPREPEAEPLHPCLIPLDEVRIHDGSRDMDAHFPVGWP